MSIHSKAQSGLKQSERLSPIVIIASVLLSVSSSANAAVPQLPAVKAIPDSGKLPFGSAQRTGVNFIDLSKYGYVEQEYYLAGKAAVRDEDGKVLVNSAPYTTRILVWKPKTAAQFSGNVVVAPFNWDRESLREWGFTNRYVVTHGDVFIGVSVVKYEIQGFPLLHGIKMLQTYDAVRYGPLGVYDDKTPKRQEMAQSQDLLAQLAFLLKSNHAESPLTGLKVKHLIALSVGVGGGVLERYIQQGRHNEMRMPDGRPLFDGYMVSANQLLPVPDASQRPDAAFVLVQNEREFHRDVTAKIPMPPDTDSPRFRLYDFVGSPHLGMIETNANNGEKKLGNDVPEVPPAPPPRGATAPVCLSHNDAPVGLVFSALLNGLKRWIDGGRPMPRSSRVETVPTGAGEKIDPNTGNALGGMRPPWITVPAASYIPGATVSCGVYEPMVRYDAAKLRALYGNYATYARAFAKAKRQFVNDSYLLPENLRDLKPVAKRQDFDRP